MTRLPLCRLALTMGAAVFVFLVGCDLFSSSTAPAQNQNIAGTWEFQMTVSDDRSSWPVGFTLLGADAVLIQTPPSTGVTGTWDTPGADGGRISGTVFGDVFEFSIVQGDGVGFLACDGDFAGSVAIESSARMTGNLSGDYDRNNFPTTCQGTLQANVVARRRGN